VKRRREWFLCLVCDGAGWKRRTRAEKVEWDAYLELPVEQAVGLPTMPVGRRRDDAALAAQEVAYGWERARRAHDRHGSYGELRRALSWLAVVEPERHALIRAVLVDHEQRRLGRVEQAGLELGVIALALRMRTVRVPPWLIERSAAEERRESVEALAAAGLGAGEIARRLGLSKKAVRRRLTAVRPRSYHRVVSRGPEPHPI